MRADRAGSGDERSRPGPTWRRADPDATRRPNPRRARSRCPARPSGHTRTAADRTQSRFLEEHADDEIRTRLLAIKDRGGFAGVHWAPRGPAEVPEDPDARLVVLSPDTPHTAGTETSDALQMAAAILQERSGGPRLNRNALVFAAPDATRLSELRAAARSYLAWKSIWDEKEELNLDELSRRQAQTQRDNFDETVKQRINETFVWTLVPSQEKESPEITWEPIKVQGTDPLPVRVSKRLEQSELLIARSAPGLTVTTNPP